MNNPGILARLLRALGVQPHSSSPAESSPSPVAPQELSPVEPQEFRTPPAWTMPVFRGRAISEWLPEIARLKRENQLDEALQLARGCMYAMAGTARNDPKSVMDFYVIEVVKIQGKQKDYRGIVDTIGSWLATGLPERREDERVDLLKRLAKAKEQVARAEGEDSSDYHRQWRELLEYEKANKQRWASQDLGRRSGSSEYPGSQTGQRRGGGGAGNRGAGRARGAAQPAKWIPSQDKLLLDTFVAVDFETANRLGGVSACQIALVKLHKGQIVDRMETLIKPPAGFDRFDFTYLHGIGPTDVKASPTWDHIAAQVDAFVGGVPVYAHNAAFDAKVWKELDEHFGTATLPADFYCSYRTARRITPGFENYKLPTVVGHLVPGFELDHHEAGSDAEACGLIVAELQRRV